MKKILTALALISFSISSFAQTIWKDTVTYGCFPKDGNLYAVYDTIYNNTASPLTVTWSKTGELILPGWSSTGICDGVAGSAGGTCYLFSDASTHTLVIPANGKGYIDVQIKAIPTADDYASWVTLTTSVGPMTYKFITCPTAVKEFDNSTMVTLYPNPATNFINITLNDKKITNINILNVIGRKIARFDVDATKNSPIRVPLENVADGIYLLQFADANGKVLGVRRVTKQ